jgi:ribosomal-protein-serine acetyltransferase
VLPDTIQTNEREPRRWDHAFVNEIVDAVVFSLPALEPWMPWALTSLGANEMRMASSKGRSDFDEGKAWNYGLFWRNSGQFVESAGLHREDDRDCREIGYWIRTDRTQ